MFTIFLLVKITTVGLEKYPFPCRNFVKKPFVAENVALVIFYCILYTVPVTKPYNKHVKYRGEGEERKKNENT